VRWIRRPSLLAHAFGLRLNDCHALGNVDQRSLFKGNPSCHLWVEIA